MRGRVTIERDDDEQKFEIFVQIDPSDKTILEIGTDNMTFVQKVAFSIVCELKTILAEVEQKGLDWLVACMSWEEY